MPKLNIILFGALLISFIAFACPKAYALSEYGLRCEDNKKCVACKSDLKCMKCMAKCTNAYGPADTDIKRRITDKEESCQQTRAKWCNAQCWDTDDVKDPDYVSTKPKCSQKSFWFPPGGTRNIDGVTK